MRALLKKVFVFACLGLMLTACAREQSATVSATVDQDFVNA